MQGMGLKRADVRRKAATRAKAKPQRSIRRVPKTKTSTASRKAKAGS